MTNQIARRVQFIVQVGTEKEYSVSTEGTDVKGYHFRWKIYQRVSFSAMNVLNE